MRITDFQKTAILESVTEELGEEARVFLFGSRTDDAQRGGDIDLFVETPVRVDDAIRKKMNILSRIQRKIGEQKIDLIMTYPGEFNEEDIPLIISNARKEGIPL